MTEKILHLKESNFDQHIKNGVALVDFFAQWCGPCRMLAPILEEIAEEMQNKAVIAKVDIDEEVSLTSKFQITSVPTLIIFKDGKEFDRVIGLKDADSLKNIIQKAL